MAVMKKQYELEGLCCGHCAAKIEQEICCLDGVSKANVDFAAKLLTIELTNQAMPETIAEQAESIAKRHDSDIELKERDIPESGKRVMYLLGLDCADCAKKIETAVRQMDGVESAGLDFVTQKLTIEASEKGKLPLLVRQAS
ncbi:MAG: heavy metal translocating P-type ATPase, partial [Ruminococcaceae bacterium]|nr:heavy metal translocating P-type ATPase [Oscillospiraceae bacterium]